MPVSSDFSELRSVLHGTPSHANFARVMSLLYHAKDSCEVASLEHYASAALDRWPSEARHLFASHAYIATDRSNPFASLVHHLTMNQGNQYRYAHVNWIDGFVGNPYLDRLRSLDLSHCVVTQSALRKFCEAENFSCLRELRLASVKLGEEGAYRISMANWLDGLEVLDLSCTGAGESVRHLFGTERARHLRVLDVEDEQIGAASFEALGHAEHLTRLEELRMRRCGLDEVHADFLASNVALANLRHLDLAENDLGRSGVESIADATHCMQLESLDLSRTWTAQRGIDALARASHLASLKRLWLDGSHPYGGRMNMQDIRPLFEAPQFAGLEALCVSRALDSKAARMLAYSAHMNHLRYVGFPHSEPKKSGYASWIEAEHLSSVRALDLSYTKLDAEHLELLISAPFFGELEELKLEHNKIDARALEVLSRGLDTSKVRKLELEYNPLSDKEQDAFWVSEVGEAITRRQQAHMMSEGA